MGLERPRIVRTGRPQVPPSPPSHAKKPENKDDAASPASSIDTLISRFRASAITSRRSEHDDQATSGDGENDLGNEDEDDQSVDDEACESDEDDGLDFDVSPSLSPLTFSPVRPLPPPSRASNTSVGSSTRQVEYASPVRSRDNMKRAPGTTFFRRGNTNSGDGKAEEVSPMPKLTQQPRTKPSLLLKSKPSLLLKPKPSLLLQPKPVPLTTKVSERIAHSVSTRSSSSARARSPGRSRLPRSPLRQATKVFRPCRTLQSKDEDESDEVELSSLSPPSSATDRGSTPGSSSLDSLVGRDLEHLHKLLSTAKCSPDGKRGLPQRPREQPVSVAIRSCTSDEVTAVLRQSTRFRRHDEKKNGQEEATKSKESSFRLRLDTLPISKRAPATSERRYDQEFNHNNDYSSDENGEESFVEELNILGASFRKSIELDKQKKALPAKLKAAAACTHRGDDHEITESTTANIRAASDAIDKALLLALQPFERLKKQQEQADAVEASEAAKTAQENPITSAASADLPIASQRIVEQLDLAFGDLTQQRHAELKAIEDAETAAKKAEEEKTKAEAEAKAAAEKATRAQEMEVLRLLPLHGKLLSCSMDIDEALIQLEASERWKKREVQLHTLGENKSVADAIATLRADTERKIREIETKATRAEQVAMDTAPPQVQAKAVRSEPVNSWWEPRESDLLREHFDAPDGPSPLDASQYRDECPDQLDHVTVPDDDRDFHGVIQREVVEKLNLTILKLRHVLSIDEKEAQEAAAREKEQDEVKRKQQVEKAAQNAKKKRELEDAEAARQRVMGLTSLDQVHEWAEADDQLRSAKDQAVHALAPRSSVGDIDNRGALWQSEFDHEQEIQRFQQLERIMQPRDDEDGAMMSVAFSDDNAHCRRSSRYPDPDPDRTIHKLACSGGYESDESYLKFADSETEEALKLPNRLPRRTRLYEEMENHAGPAPHPRSWHDGRRRRVSKASVVDEGRFDWRRPQMPVRSTIESTRTRHSASSRASSDGKRSRLERSFAATIQSFQSDRRAKAKWFKQSNAAA